MRRFFLPVLLIVAMVSLPGLAFGWSIWGNETFRGKLIDADTYEPIEEAVVVMVWSKSWPGIGAGATTDFMMARETMTDANGEWSIRGPKGKYMYECPILTILSLITYIHVIQPPSIHYYKPGYCRLGHKPGGFSAYPYINKSKGMIGIILSRTKDSAEETHTFYKMHEGKMAFIPVADPIAKLRSLDFPLQYTEDYLWIEREWFLEIPFYLFGAKKAETLEERRKALLEPGDIDTYADLPLLEKISRGERDFLFNKRRSMK